MTDYLHLRPHHLLCLLSFSGKGYSPQFIEQLKKIQQTFFSRETRIEISPGTDEVCEICPERAGDCCGRLIGITDNELDQRVRQTLGIESGQYLAEVLWRTLAQSYHEELGYQICEGCTWLAEGNCPAKIVQRLHHLLDETQGKIDGVER
jgi:hypothetical protein